MEASLHLYRLPYTVERPVVWFDELPIQLLGDVVAPLPMQAHKPARMDYEYTRGGTAAL